MAFNVPINSIAPIQTPSNWVRPSDWPVITDTPNEVQFLVADVNAKVFTIETIFTRTSGNIYIDWGDGVTDTITTIATTNTTHTYSTGGTPCSRGYNTFKIRIYGDATCVITSATFVASFAQTGGGPYYTCGLLEAYYGNNVCNGGSMQRGFNSVQGSTSSVLSFSYLEYVKLPATVTWTSLMFGFFWNCNALAVVVMPTSGSGLTSFASTFNGCANLLDIIIPANATLVNSFASTFSGCYNLRTVTLPSTLNSVTTFASTFGSCFSLKNVTIPSINLATSLSDMFGACRSLQWVRFTSLPSPVSPSTSISITNIFNGCSVLQNVFLPNTCSSNSIYNAGSIFLNCYTLKNIIFPTNFNASTLANCFSGCSSITNIVFQSAMPSLTAIDSAFNGCFLLSSITLPATVGASITMSSAFFNCNSLPSIVIPSSWNISGSVASTFTQCYNATSIILPNNSQNGITAMNNLFFNCYKLRTVVLPTSLTGATTLANTFSLCYELTSATLPASMNSVTTCQSTFSGCRSLTSVTLPTSMSACTIFSTMFSGCWSIQTITMPTTVPSSASLSAITNVCPNLKTLTLPTTQLSLNTSIDSIFNSCGSLTTINNFDKAGSLTSTPLLDASNSQNTWTGANLLTSLSYPFPLSRLQLMGQNTTNFNKLNSLRLLNASAGQWTGASPQINVSFCDLSTAALNTLFADIAAQGNVVSKTINITSCTGAAGLTAGDRLVLTSKGWTITG
jgi:hypothetical protein